MLNGKYKGSGVYSDLQAPIYDLLSNVYRKCPFSDSKVDEEDIDDKERQFLSEKSSNRVKNRASRWLG